MDSALERGSPACVQRHASQGSGCGRGSWGAVSNVAADLQPHVKRAFIQAFLWQRLCSC